MRDLNRLLFAVATLTLRCMMLIAFVGPLASAAHVRAAPPALSALHSAAAPSLRCQLLLARARDLLSQKRYTEVLELTGHLVARDPSFEARYLHGIACARLERWTCASRMLTPIATSSEAAHFPDLALELGAVNAGEGNLDEARVWLERAIPQSRTRALAAAWLEQLERSAQARSDARAGHSVQGSVSLGAGWDSNPLSTLRYLEGESGGEAVAVSDATDIGGLLGNVHAALRWWVTHGELEVSTVGRVAYQRYVDPRWSDYELLTGGATMVATWDKRLEAGVSGGSSWYVPEQSQRYQDALELSLRYGAVAGTGLWAGYRAGYDRYRDLWDIRDLYAKQPELGRPCDDPDDYGTPDYIAYCTAGRTGTAQEVALGIDRGRGNGPVRTVIAVGASWPEDPVWQHVWAHLDLTGRRPLPRKIALSWMFRLGWDRFAGDHAPWHSLQLSPTVVLELPRIGGMGVQVRYAPQLVLNLSGSGDVGDGSQNAGTTSLVLAQYLVRQVLLGEVTYVF